MRLLPLLLAACAADRSDDALESRRIALGLETGALPVAAAMDDLEQHEAFLRDVFARGRSGPEVLDGALRIENLLGRAAFPEEMAALRERALEGAGAFTRAAGGGDAGAAAGALLRSCLECHVRFREPR